MPLVLPQPRASDTLSLFKSKAVLASFLCAIVVVASGYFWFHNRPSTSTPKSNAGAIANPSLSRCQAPDQSFCATQVKFIAYISSGDFSGLLEQQMPLRATCGTPKAPPAACTGVLSGNLTVETFEVVQAGTPVYLPRNAYIALFNQYAAMYGPFTWAGDTVSGHDIIMKFNGSRASKILTLTFQPSAKTWLFQSPSVN